MANGHFLWTDLSTYDMRTARTDYAEFFNWSFGKEQAYEFATIGGQEVAAIFPMPDRLAKMNMPSFWMSYIHVDDLDAKVEQARTHEGVIIEVEPQPFSEAARIALVRDPSGAGFTMYEGPDIQTGAPGAGKIIGRFHHVPDIALIAPFYADLFGWRFEKSSASPWPRYDIRHPDGTVVAWAEEVPEDIRGKFRYWMPCFGVKSVGDTLRQIEARSGQHHNDLPEGRVLVSDRQGAHFMIQTLDPNGAAVGERSDSSANGTPVGVAWKSLIALVCVWLAVIMDLQVFWGVLFLIWTWLALRSGRADIVEPIDRATRPWMFWLITGTWIVLSSWVIIASVFGGW
ncbi:MULTISPECIES: VOC family protein [unclassified Ruegeria]|uniref:VOC family protein n=1 Tax=unclassified Ruegeria TaxID=2625375 RepID=UPI001489DF83|nr:MULTISPECIES: VOC family protein [unclassified Ruegeria]NOD75043.1 VOC family protein [Ruegeria sp. HKCCD4332]NOD87004.1 VOC family protein [Ruegeria sp. HKCCD4318]NOE12559.1 VOC family protein [Ruegeria sp. HKCCD4318-2]NOG09276.1 VOC family protein [Ruegeria sp. HKCCD4315]